MQVPVVLAAQVTGEQCTDSEVAVFGREGAPLVSPSIPSVHAAHPAGVPCVCRIPNSGDSSWANKSWSDDDWGGRNPDVHVQDVSWRLDRYGSLGSQAG